MHEIVLVHEVFKQVFLEFEEIVDLEVFEQRAFLLAVTEVFATLALLNEVVSTLVLVQQCLNVQAFCSLQLADEVKVVCLGVSEHSQRRSSGDLYHQSEVIALGEFFVVEGGEGLGQGVLKELLFEGHFVGHRKYYGRSCSSSCKCMDF